MRRCELAKATKKSLSTVREGGKSPFNEPYAKPILPEPRSVQKANSYQSVRVQVIDWEQPANNDFLLVSQFSVTGQIYGLTPEEKALGQRRPTMYIFKHCRTTGVFFAPHTRHKFQIGEDRNSANESFGFNIRQSRERENVILFLVQEQLLAGLGSFPLQIQTSLFVEQSRSARLRDPDIEPES